MLHRGERHAYDTAAEASSVLQTCVVLSAVHSISGLLASVGVRNAHNERLTAAGLDQYVVWSRHARMIDMHHNDVGNLLHLCCFSAWLAFLR